VTVAGQAADSALVGQVLPVAETAAAYDIKMMQRFSPGALQQQHGFVLFVSGSATVENGWFAADPQPAGWPPQFLGARAVQLPGPGVTSDILVGAGQTSLTNAIGASDVGGTRVVLAPAEPATGTVLRAEGQTLVRTFMLDLLGVQDQDLAYDRPARSVPSWAEEGFAVAVQALYEENPDPTPSVDRFPVLTVALRNLPKSYRSGVYPSTAQLFGPSLATDEDWGYVAASVYEYIAINFGFPKMIVSAMTLYSLHGQPTPLGNVYKTFTSTEQVVFYGIHSIRLGWRPWLARV